MTAIRTATLDAAVVTCLARAKEARTVGHEAVEAAFLNVMTYALTAAGVPEGVEFQIAQHEDGTATVTYTELSQPSLLVTADEGAE